MIIWIVSIADITSLELFYNFMCVNSATMELLWTNDKKVIDLQKFFHLKALQQGFKSSSIPCFRSELQLQCYVQYLHRTSNQSRMLEFRKIPDVTQILVLTE